MNHHRRRYLVAFFGFLLIETAIALWVRDQIVRPFVGDMLVVVLIYFLVQAVGLFRPRPAALSVLLFAYTIEALQAVDYAAKLKVDHLPWASVLLGRTFSWWDFVAYSAGYLVLRFDPRWPDGER